MLGKYLDRVRQENPLIHNITNYVTANDVANMLLSCGASPIMADAPEEAEEITAACCGLNLNIGTLNSRRLDAMLLAGKKAKQLGHVVLFDPVGVGASRFRKEAAGQILQEVRPDIVRGNSSEIRALLEGSKALRGVDADQENLVCDTNLDQTVSGLRRLSTQLSAVIVQTGAIDLVCDAKNCFVIRNGRPQMRSITGTGCQLSGLVTAFAAVSPKEKLEAAAAAVCAMGLAGEIGWSHMEAADGNASYRSRIIDAMYHMDDGILDKGADYEIR